MIRSAMNSMHCGGSTMPHYSWMMTLQCRSAGQDSAVTGSGLQQRQSLLSLQASLISPKISGMIRRRTCSSDRSPRRSVSRPKRCFPTVRSYGSIPELEICERAEGERRVKLCGEAYLDVARDIDRPFIVETSHMEVRVLGTRFNVNAYDEKQSVVLVSGSVDVTALEQGESSRIRPEEMFTYDARTGERQIRLVDTNNFVSWTEGFLQFKSAPLEQVFMQLQHFYGVRINCDSHLTEEIMISGKLELRTGLESALNHLKLLAPISYMRSGEREIDITIRQ